MLSTSSSLITCIFLLLVVDLEDSTFFGTELLLVATEAIFSTLESDYSNSRLWLPFLVKNGTWIGGWSVEGLSSLCKAFFLLIEEALEELISLSYVFFPMCIFTIFFFYEIWEEEDKYSKLVKREEKGK